MENEKKSSSRVLLSSVWLIVVENIGHVTTAQRLTKLFFFFSFFSSFSCPFLLSCLPSTVSSTLSKSL